MSDKILNQTDREAIDRVAENRSRFREHMRSMERALRPFDSRHQPDDLVHCPGIGPLSRQGKDKGARLRKTVRTKIFVEDGTVTASRVTDGLGLGDQLDINKKISLLSLQ